MCPNPAPNSRAPESAAVDRDLYCLKCGYNLRGLSGDPIRCPECGYDNPIADAVIPADLIAAQLRKMETAPAQMLWAILVVLSSGPMLLLTESRKPVAVLVLPALVMAFAAISFVVNAYRYRNSCLRKPTWLTALVKYASCGIFMIAITVIPPFFVLNSVAGVFNGAAGHSVKKNATWLVPVALAYVAATVFFDLRLYRRVKRDMEQLQREVAVTLARQEIDKRLHGTTRRGFLGLDRADRPG